MSVFMFVTYMTSIFVWVPSVLIVVLRVQQRKLWWNNWCIQALIFPKACLDLVPFFCIFQEVKDANQAKWYKRMYDSLHRSGKDGKLHFTLICVDKCRVCLLQIMLNFERKILLKIILTLRDLDI